MPRQLVNFMISTPLIRATTTAPLHQRQKLSSHCSTAMAWTIAARCVSRRFVSSGRILSEEGKLAVGNPYNNKGEDFNASDTMDLSESGRTLKKNDDGSPSCTLVRVGARLSQMENKTRILESSVDHLKASIKNNHGSTQGQLRQLENMLSEIMERQKLDKLAREEGGPKPDEQPVAASTGGGSLTDNAKRSGHEWMAAFCLGIVFAPV